MDKATWIGIVLAVLTLLSFLYLFEQKPEGRVVADDEWCEVGQKMADGTIVFNGERGTTELVAIATANGPVLMGKCK